MSLRALSIGATGLASQSSALDIAAHNLANLETPGFRRQRGAFENLLAQQIGSGVALSGTQVDTKAGSLEQTGRPLDLAIQGRGYVAVSDGGQSFYSRAGNLTVDGIGRLSLPANGALLPIQPEIRVPSGADSLSIASDGTVTAVSASGQPLTLGKIEAVDFVNPEGLIGLAGNLYAASPASGSARAGQWGSDGFGQLVPGSLETSNVDLTEEIVSTISIQQSFQLSAEVIRAAQERLDLLKTLNR